MKQEIIINSDGSIRNKYDKNHLGQRHGLSIYYHNNGDIWYKQNWFNGKKYGIKTWYYQNSKRHTIYN